MNQLVPFRSGDASPALIAAAGESAKPRFLEFFTANIRNRNTRRAYAQAASEFLAWCEHRRVPSITAVQPMHVAGKAASFRDPPSVRLACGCDPKGPLFPTIARTSGQLTTTPLPQANAHAMIRRAPAPLASRPRSAIIPSGQPASRRTSRTAARSKTRPRSSTIAGGDEVNLDEVERISI
jgi:hypothetical protein